MGVYFECYKYIWMLSRTTSRLQMHTDISITAASTASVMFSALETAEKEIIILMMSVFSVSLSADKNACVGAGSVLPYCHSYHFSETSLCSQYFATDFSGLRKSGYLFALNKEKKMWFVMLSFFRKAKERFTGSK